MSTRPAACAGATAVSSVALTTTTLVAATPPTVTEAPARKLVPVSLSAVPPTVDARAGATVVSVGPSRNSKPSASEPLCASVLVTCTVTLPFACAGVVTVSELGLSTLTLVPADPPKSTLAPAMKPVPVIVTAVPPPFDPLAGARALTVGAVVAAYV